MTASNRDPDERDLERLFAELRAHDRRLTPAFESVLGAARSRGRRRPAAAPRLVAAAVLVLVAAGALLLVRLRGHAARVGASSLGAWRSPTASLLEMPGAALLQSVPSVSASVVNLGPAAVPDRPTTLE